MQDTGHVTAPEEWVPGHPGAHYLATVQRGAGNSRGVPIRGKKGRKSAQEDWDSLRAAAEHVAWGDGAPAWTDPAAQCGAPSSALLPRGACGAGAGQGVRAEAQNHSKDHIYLGKGAQSAPDLGRKKGGDGERKGIAESWGRGEMAERQSEAARCMRATGRVDEVQGAHT